MARTKRKVNPVVPAPEQERSKQRIYRAGGYVRLSIEDSGRPGADTIENQKELVSGYIESRSDMEFAGLYCDNGWTGTDFSRPEFERMMQDVRTGKIDCIVVKDLSRFGRNYRETGNYLERIFPFLDVRFVAVSDQFDTLDAERSSDGYIVPLKNIINEAYSKDISKKVGSGYAIKQRKGEFTGTWAAYGYQKCEGDPHRIEPNKETAPVVRDIFRQRILGKSYTLIARELNRQGIASPARYHYLKGDAKSERYACAEWSPKVVGDILLNEVYLGHMVQGRKRQSFSEGKKQQLLPQGEWAIVRNTHEPLIDEDTFRKVQEAAKYSKASYLESYGKRPSTPNILKGLVYCADCGHRMTRFKSVIGKGTKAVYSYVCRSHTLDPLSCPLKSMPELKLIEILWDILKRQFALADRMSKQAEVFQRSGYSREVDDMLKNEADAAGQALRRAQALYDNLYPMYAEEKILTEQEYMQMKKVYQAQIVQAQKVIEDIETKKRTHRALTEENPWLKACTDFSGEDALTEEMAHAFISRIEIGTDRQVSVELRYQDEFRKLVKLGTGGEAEII